jgi:carbamoyl-phosphate synthase large subunit
MKAVRVLIPSIGHPTRPSLVQAMRDNGERVVEVLGADMDADGIGPHVADDFVQVPARTDPGYLDRILEICRERRVDVYYALGEEEAIASAERAGEFRAAGVAVITPGAPEMLRIATNKARYHEFLRARGVPHARFRVIGRFEEIEPALRQLGYPEEDVFLKPAFSKGGRGARLVVGRSRPAHAPNGKAGDAPAESLAAALDALRPRENGAFPQMIAMEHLPGTYYSVDVLSRDGGAYYAIPKIRVHGSASNTTVGQVDLDAAAIAMARRLCAAFGFSFLQNYEMKLDRDGRPRVYDINPRGGTSLILCAAAGANIAYYAVKMALGEEVPERPVRDRVRMLRYYQEYFRFPA